MNAVLVLVIGCAILIASYVFYGKWLSDQWGVDEKRVTPAHELEDGMDYVPAKAPVLMGHHFSSIAGAGPINGPIQAAVFGWVPVMLWVLIGGIFFGAVHDFGSLFASIRHKGQSIGEVIAANIGERAKKLFIIFSYLTLILVVAAFASIVANTFNGFTADGALNHDNAAVAMISLLFIVMAIVFGFFVYRKGAPLSVATIVGVIALVACLAIGLNFHPIYLNGTTWMYIIGVYILIASIAPVWILLQPRDYLSSFLLYGMMIVAVVGIIGGTFTGAAVVSLPAFTGWTSSIGTLFPALFITVACGAVSGFHSLIGSGTTSKQLDSEKDAKVIGYGAMIVESGLAIISLIAVGVVWTQLQAGHEVMTMGAPPTIFAGGIATLVASFAGEATYKVVYTLLTLAVSVFALTSLDSGTRLARYMFAELFIPEGKTRDDLTGFAKVMSHPFVATLIMVIIGCGMGFMGLKQIWGVFGAANQLLAGIAMLAVAAWLGNIGKNNKMFFVPMVFMLAATCTSLTMTVIAKIKLIAGMIPDKVAAWGDWFQMIWSIGLVVLAIILVIEGVQVIAKPKAKKAE